ncbi:MAG: pilus assembly protein PilP [Dokdonella sp.]|uniref:pilus assembly protein PilP n=1 Tax=Dokdonella sp. TaxID=2291710 RepID=UPI0025C1E374|nr:pilus assembly protein PilP [Dokdonella sp.]MBZ0223513.1 pilus assembly protein PilP [Dokdonella sp.]MCC7255146.1 pilus assembly protein PilP [Dokdonella sp.]
MSRLRVHHASVAAIVISILLLQGCTPTESVQQWVNREKAKKGAPLAPLPVIKTFEAYIYKDQDLRDPFGPSLQEQEQANAQGPHPDQNRPREPLESFPLDGLKMSGTLGIGKTMEGLVRDPDGVVHRVRVGNYLGQNYGHVKAIEEDHIDLVELVPNGAGGWMERQATIALGESKP